MEFLLQAIEEKLSHVDSERNRWLQYKEEHVQAAQNLHDFQKSFRKEILVPIGSKALMPGQLYHTNEIFVGMYRGLFVKCSADKALTVCEHRLAEANKHLDALDVEYKMYRDRLELPVNEQVFGNTEKTQEIIEDYNEEEEQKWREQHKIKMREYKKAEAEERKQLHKNDDIDINAILEQAELMEELENELEELNIDDDEKFKEHLQSNMAKLEKIVNDTLKDAEDDTDSISDEEGSREFLDFKKQASSLNTEDKIKFYEIHLQKTREYISQNPYTMQNLEESLDKRVTEECLLNAIEELQETLNNNANEIEYDNDEIEMTFKKEDSNLPFGDHFTEPRKFHKRIDFLAIEAEYNEQNKTKSELLVFYKSQLKNVVKSLASSSFGNHSNDEKRDLYEFLSDRISSLRDEIQREKQIKLEEDFVDDDDIDKPVKKLGRPFDPDESSLDVDDDKDDELTGKRKISFASQPLTVTFYEDDEPYVVSQENVENLADSAFQFFNSPSSSSASSVCGDDEENANNENEHLLNSTNDCDTNFPMNQFNDKTTKEIENCTSENLDNFPDATKPPTLILQFNHTENPCTSFVSNDDETINSPLDIYRQFGVAAEVEPITPPAHNSNPVSQLDVSHIEDKLNKNIKDATETSEVLPDVKPLEVPNIDAKPQKSILKNGNLVKNESRAPITGDNYEDIPTTIESSEEFPGFMQVLGDIVERSSTDESNTLLNQEDKIQSNEEKPKKRVSLFKRSRMS